jgi:F-type H+-transporting ATPase subunit epsilon
VSGFTLHLQSATQYARFEGVESFVARDASGAFGVMARHERMMTVLAYGMARFRITAGAWRYLALPGGLAYFVEGELYLSTRRFVLGDDFGTVAASVDSTLLAEDSAQRSLKESVTRLEREMVRRLWQLGGHEA